MSVTVSRREGAVIFFFWALTIILAVMTAVNLLAPAAPQRRVQAPDTTSMEARIAQLEAHLQASPADVEAMVALGDAYLDTQRTMDAFRLFQRVVQLDPGHVHALSDLGNLYQQIGKYDHALESYRRAYESQPDHSSLLLNMALIYGRHKGENAKALELLRTFLAGNPEAQLIATAEQEIARIEQAMKEAGGNLTNPLPTSR